MFGNVLIEQAGLPVPAYPMLIAAGAGRHGRLAGAVDRGHAGLPAGRQPLVPAGRRYGSRLLGVVCKLSLSQDSCIRQTQRLYLRVVRALLVCKFLPGAGALSTVMAGLTGTGLRRFLLYDLVGAMIWAGSALLLGGLFHGVVNDVLDLLANYGAMGLGLLAALLALYIVARCALGAGAQAARHPEAVGRRADALASGRPPALVFDVRPEAQRDAQRIPGAIAVDLRAPLPPLEADAQDADIVVIAPAPTRSRPRCWPGGCAPAIAAPGRCAAATRPGRATRSPERQPVIPVRDSGSWLWPVASVRLRPRA